jgi:hypothetical protein
LLKLCCPGPRISQPRTHQRHRQHPSQSFEDHCATFSTDRAGHFLRIVKSQQSAGRERKFLVPGPLLRQGCGSRLASLYKPPRYSTPLAWARAALSSFHDIILLTLYKTQQRGVHSRHCPAHCGLLELCLEARRRTSWLIGIATTFLLTRTCLRLSTLARKLQDDLSLV